MFAFANTLGNTVYQVGSTLWDGVSYFKRHPLQAIVGLLSIQGLTQTYSATLEEGLVAYFPFTDGSFNDFSGNGHHATASGNVIPYSDVMGNLNQAMYFSGNGYGYGSANEFPTGERTVSLMFYTISSGQTARLFGYGGGSCGTSFWMAVRPDSYEVQAHCTIDKLNAYYGNFPSGAWHHWVVTSDASGTKMYLSGNLLAGNTSPFGPTTVSGGQFAIGVGVSPSGGVPYTDGSGSYWIGVLDEVRIYNRALNTSEIGQLYAIDMLSNSPTHTPSQLPSITPTGFPSLPPTNLPSQLPSTSPSRSPTTLPTVFPTIFPSNGPTRLPSQFPSYSPTATPTAFPSRNPSHFPTRFSSHTPTDNPTHVPTIHPVRQNGANTSTDDNPSSWMIPVLLTISGSSCLLLCCCGLYLYKQKQHNRLNNINQNPVHNGVNMANLSQHQSNLHLPAPPQNPNNALTPGYQPDHLSEEEEEENEEMYDKPLKQTTVSNMDNEEQKEKERENHSIQQAKNIIFFPSNELPPKSKFALESKIKSARQLLDQCYTDNDNNEGESDYRKSYLNQPEIFSQSTSRKNFMQVMSTLDEMINTLQEEENNLNTLQYKE